jgi:cation transport regulator ChaB
MQADKITIQNPLQPAILRIIREAFDAAIEEAAQRRRGHALSLEMETRVAKHIVETARKGVHCRDGLRDAALDLLPH